VFEDRFHLLTGYARKPAQEIVYAGSIFKVLEESLHGHTRSLETNVLLTLS
jgi:hypothetical protein